jgi:hypothetical protein
VFGSTQIVSIGTISFVRSNLVIVMNRIRHGSEIREYGTLTNKNERTQCLSVRTQIVSISTITRALEKLKGFRSPKTQRLCGESDAAKNLANLKDSFGGTVRKLEL